MIELCCANLSVRCIWISVITTSRASFRVNLHSLTECQETLCLKQVPYRKFNWQQRGSHSQPIKNNNNNNSNNNNNKNNNNNNNNDNNNHNNRNNNNNSNNYSNNNNNNNNNNKNNNKAFIKVHLKWESPFEMDFSILSWKL